MKKEREKKSWDLKRNEWEPQAQSQQQQHQPNEFRGQRNFTVVVVIDNIIYMQSWASWQLIIAMEEEDNQDATEGKQDQQISDCEEEMSERDFQWISQKIIISRLAFSRKKNVSSNWEEVRLSLLFTFEIFQNILRHPPSFSHGLHKTVKSHFLGDRNWFIVLMLVVRS